MDDQAFAQLLGNYGEFVGAIAVVVTLLILTAQVRAGARVTAENSRLLRVGIIRNADESISGWGRVLASDAEATRIWRIGCGGENLDKDEAIRYRWIARNYLGVHAVSFYEFQSLSDEVMKNRYVLFVANEIAGSPGLQRIWEGMTTTPFSALYPEFYEAVNHELRSQDI